MSRSWPQTTIQLVPGSTCTVSTPRALATSAVTATAQWRHAIPGTRNRSSVIGPPFGPVIAASMGCVADADLTGP
jgi:hypothetical protein